MATPVKQIKTSDNTLHDIMAGEYIIGTQSAATNMWKGASESDALYAGKVINYKLPYAGSTNTNTHTGLTTNTTLELTLADGSTVVNPVYRNASSAITTHYPVNSVIRLIFDPTSVTLGGHTFAGSWKTADYDANTNTYVAQSNTTTNGYLPLILKATTATATVTTTVRFNSNLTGNPSTGDIKLKSTTIKPTATTANTVNLPTSGGTLALLSDIPTTLPPTAHTHSASDIQGLQTVSASSNYSSGNNIGSVTIDGTTTNLYEPRKTYTLSGTITPAVDNFSVIPSSAMSNETRAQILQEVANGYDISLNANVSVEDHTLQVSAKYQRNDTTAYENNTSVFYCYGAAAVKNIYFVGILLSANYQLMYVQKAAGDFDIPKDVSDLTDNLNKYSLDGHTHPIGSIYNGTSALSINTLASDVKMDGTASAGSGSALALANHVHPTDTSRAPLASPAFSGTPTAPTPTTTLGIANKGYVDSVLGGITQVDYSVTTTLPATGVKGTVYLVAHEHDASQNDYYDEYIYANNAWEKIGHTDIDLSDYATKSFVSTTLVNDGIKVIDLGEQTIPVYGGMGQLTVSSDVSSEIDSDFQNKNLALRIHYSGDIDNPGSHVIVFNIGDIEYSGMNFHGFQGSYTLSNLKIYECFIGIGFGASAGVNLIGVIRQFDNSDRATMSDNTAGYHGVSLMNENGDSHISMLNNGDTSYYVHQFKSVLVYDIGDISLTSTELTSLGSGNTVSKTISIDFDTWNNILNLHYNPGVALTTHIKFGNAELSKYSLLNEGTLSNGNKQFSGVVAINGSSTVFALLTIDANSNSQNSLIMKPIPSVDDMETALGSYLTESDISTTTATVIGTVSGITFGISVSNGILEIGSTVGISSITSTTTTAVTSVSIT